MEDRLINLSYWVSMLKQETDCSICLNTLKDPVTTSCFHTFCKKCITRVIRVEKSRCPLCKKQINRRNTEINNKVQRLIDKINPIIQGIKNESSIDLFSYYKGKTTAISLECVHPRRSVIGEDYSDTRPFVNQNIDLNDINHVSVSQNLGQYFNSEVSTLNTSLLPKIPILGKVNSPSKKVRDWLSENEVEDRCSPFPNQSFPTIAQIENIVESEEIGHCKRKIKDRKVSSDEQSKFHSSEISLRRKSLRKVYKGLKPGNEKFSKSDEWTYLENSKKNMESELQKDHKIQEDEVQDSCPVDVNDTFDKLLLEVRKPDHSVLYQEKSEGKVQEDEIGLFESFPLPAENVSFKRKRGSNMLEMPKDYIGVLPNEFEVDQSVTEINREKCFRKESHLLKENVGCEVGCVDIKSAGIGLGKTSGCTLIENYGAVKSSHEGKISHLQIQENNSLSKKGSKNNSLERKDFSSETPKSGRKKLCLSLQSHDWSCVKNACIDFSDSKKKIILHTLDVSGGDPRNTSINEGHISESSENNAAIQDISIVPSFLSDDMKKPTQQIISTSIEMVSEKLDKSLLPNSNKFNVKQILKIDDIERTEQAGILNYEEKISHYKFCNDSRKANISIYGSLAKSDVTDVDLCRREGHLLLCSSTKNKSLDLQKVNSPRNKRKLMSLGDVVEERKTFLLDSSTQDLSKLTGNIERGSTEDQLVAFSKSSQKSTEEKSPIKVIALDVKKTCNSENEVLKRMPLYSENCNANEDSKLSSSKKHILPCKRTKPKPLVPIIKLGKLKSKQSTGVKYLLLGRLRHSDIGGKLTSEVCIGTKSFTPKRSLPRPCVCSKSKKFTEDHHMDGSEDRLQLMPPSIPFSLNQTLLKLPDRQTNEGSEKSGGIVNITNCHGEEKNAICQTVIDKEISNACEENEELFKGDFSQQAALLPSVEVCEVDNIISGEVIPSTERSGPKKLFINKLKNARSNSDQYLNIRKDSTSSRKLVCQLFDENSGDAIDIAEEEMAHPIVYSQLSVPSKNMNEHSKKPISVSSKDSEDISLFSGSRVVQEIDHGSQIKRSICNNHKSLTKNMEFASVGEHLKMVMTTKMISLEKGICSPTEIICSGKETPGTIELESSDEMSQDNEGIDDEVLAMKDEQITANIEADLKNRGNIKNERNDNDASKDVKSFTYLNYKRLLPLETNIIPDSAKSFVDDSDLSEREESDDKMSLSFKKQHTSNMMSQTDNFLKNESGEESDCIVESSPRSPKTIKKYMPTKRCSISLVASGLSGKEVSDVKVLAQRLNLHFNQQFCWESNEMGLHRTTHVIAKVDSDGKTSCTFKYLCGLLTACWILSMKWVIDCLSYGRLIEEEPYEVLDALGGNGPYRGRHLTNKLFNGFKFICRGPFGDLTEEQMKVLIELGGGKVISVVYEVSNKKGKCLAIAGTTSVDMDFRRQMQLHDVAIISYEWVIECVEEVRILPLMSYVLNQEAEKIDTSKIRNNLLSMGYPELLTRYEDDEMVGSMKEVEEFGGED